MSDFLCIRSTIGESFRRPDISVQFGAESNLNKTSFVISKAVMFKTISLSAVTILMLSSAVNAQLNEDRFDELMKSIVPAEKTTEVNWLPDVLSAQKASLEQQKPIFIWSMDGNPLGCT